MTYNTIAYIIYGIVILYVTIIIGDKFHKNGIHYLLKFQSDHAIAHAINNILLVLYYCLNLGYSIAAIFYWEKLISMIDLINSLGNHVGMIVIGLGLIHYLNLSWIYLFYKFSKLKSY